MEIVEQDTSDQVAPDTVTGVPEVDRVLRSLEALDTLELPDHVAVFEAAHASLQDALDAPAPPDEQKDGA